MKKQGTYNEHNEKWCSNCKEYHHRSLFGRNKHSKDGIGFTCIESRRKPKEIGMFIPGKLHIQSQWQYKRPDAWDNFLQSIQVGIRCE